MNDFIMIKMDKNNVLDMLIDRLLYWIKDHDNAEKEIEIKLFSEMYENSLDGGVFESVEFDPMDIVDNDYVNWCAVIDPTNDDYEKILKVYEKNGIGDCSCENIGFSFIESTTVYNNKRYFLMRY